MSRAKSVTSPEKDMTRTLGSPTRMALAMSTRSAMVNRVLERLSEMATTTDSWWAATRFTTSWWPRVSGSKVPG